jgi:hypothetical protein
MENLAADLPPDLYAVDSLLERYGSWAVNHRRVHRCASAEGRYRAEVQRRADNGQPLTRAQVLDAQRALAAVPDRLRTVLILLYIPRRVPVTALLRKNGITPAVCRERHVAGLREFERVFSYLAGVSAKNLHSRKNL